MITFAFYFMLKALLFLRYLHFCPVFLIVEENGLTRKLRLISKIHDVTDRNTKNYNTHIAQYLKK